MGCFESKLLGCHVGRTVPIGPGFKNGGSVQEEGRQHMSFRIVFGFKHIGFPLQPTFLQGPSRWAKSTEG